MLKTAAELEKLGTELARKLDWNGVQVLEVAWSALTDCGFHDEAAIVEQMAKALNASGNELKYELTIKEEVE